MQTASSVALAQSFSRLSFQSTNFDVVSRNNQPWLSLPQIEGALGYTNKGKGLYNLFQRNADEFTPSMTQLVKLQTAGGEQEVRIFSLRGAHLLGMFARTEKAKEFRKWILDILDAVAPSQPALPQFITPAQQSALQAAVAQRAGESGGIRAALWSRFNNHFKLGSYKQLPAAQFDEALEYLQTMPLKTSSDRFHVTAAELDAMIVQRAALQLPDLAQSPCPTYSAPSSLIKNLSNQKGRTGWLTADELNRIPLERLPLNSLLKALEKDGHDIGGAKLEYQALRHLMEAQHNALGMLARMMESAGKIGLRVEVAA